MLYAAFLRGINLGGATTVKMADLSARFETIGFTSVSTLRASGNVGFEAGSMREPAVVAAIETDLATWKGFPVQAFVRSADELRSMIASDPFSAPGGDGATPYVTLLAAPSPASPRPPLRDDDGHVHVFRADPRDVYSWCRSFDGKPGFPNRFVETRWKVSATTRNWSTILGMDERFRATDTGSGATPARGSPSGSGRRRTRR